MEQYLSHNWWAHYIRQIFEKLFGDQKNWPEDSANTIYNLSAKLSEKSWQQP